MKKFLYVFSPEDRDKLISRKYTMLKCDDKNDVYIFINNSLRQDERHFDLNTIQYVTSDTLTF